MLTPVDPSTVMFAPDRLLEALTAGSVRFIVIGGMAALLHGDIVGTADVDAAVAEEPENLHALVEALTAMEARILVDAGRGELATIDVPLDVAWFTRMASLRLLTVHGIFDVVLTADGVGRHAAWDVDATDVELGGYLVRVASLDAVIRSKEAAGRPKDLAALPRLRELRRRTRT